MIFRIAQEGLRTLSVTTYHPLGWSLGRLHSRLRRQSLSDEELRIEHSCPILLVHGIFHNSTAFYAIEKSLRKNGFSKFSTLELWTSIQSIERMARQLKQRVRQLLEIHQQKPNAKGKVRLVSHSLGGIIVRAALRDAEFAQMVDKIIFLGVPHQGNLFYKIPYPPCVKDLSHSAPLMKELREHPLSGGVQYWNLRGTLDLVTPSRDTFLPHVPNLYFEGVGHAGLLSAPRVLQAIIAILETPLYDTTQTKDSVK